MQAPVVVEPAPEPAPNETPADPAAEAAKKARAINKKLKQISDLEAKQAAGTTVTPEQEQKIAKRASLEAELAELS